MRRFLSVILSICMLISCVSVYASFETTDVQILENSGEYKLISLYKTTTGVTKSTGSYSAVLVGIKADGTEETITSGASYTAETIGDSSAITVTKSGMITPVNSGISVLKATYGNLTASVTITVGAAVYSDGFETLNPEMHPTVAYQSDKSNSYANNAKGYLGTVALGTTEARSGKSSLEVLSLTKKTATEDFLKTLYKEGGIPITSEGIAAIPNVMDLRVPVISATESWKNAISKLNAVVEYWIKPRDNFMSYDGGQGGKCHQSNGINMSFNGDKIHPLRGNLRSDKDGYWCWLEETTHKGVIVNNKIPVKNEWTQIVVDASNADGTVNLYIDGVLFRTHKCDIEGCGCKNKRVFDEFQFTRNVASTPVEDDNGGWIDDIVCYDMSVESTMPTVSVVAIDGRTVSGNTVSGRYHYYDVNGDDESGSTYRWLWSDSEKGEYTVIPGATDIEFTIPKELDNKYIAFEVTPKNNGQDGDMAEPVRSNGYLINNNPPSVSYLKISGMAFSGEAVKLGYLFKDEDGDEEKDSDIRWYISETKDGQLSEIKGASSKELLILPEYAGKYICASVMPKDAFGAVGEIKYFPAILVGDISDANKIINAVFVSPKGDDSNEGTIDSPLATLEGAKNKIRELKKNGSYPIGGFTVYFRGGIYEINDTVEFTFEDSGETEAPIVYRPYMDEKVEITGSKFIPLSEFSPVSGQMKEYLIDETAKNKVMVANLADFGVDVRKLPDFWTNHSVNEISDGSFEGLSGTARSEGLYGINVEMDGKVMHLARYPNADRITSWNRVNANASKITYSEDRISNWKFSASRNFWIRGYWVYEWTCEFLQLKNINTSAKTIDVVLKCSNNPTGGSYSSQFYNVYEEIDSPGEWYLDRETGNFYVYPVDGATDESAVEITNIDKVLINAENCENVKFYNLDISGSASVYGVALNNCKNVVFDSCEIHNFGIFAFLIQGKESRNNGIINSHLYNCGSGGLRMTGGDSSKLKKSGDFLKNTYLHDCAILKNCYSPFVDLTYNGDYEEGTRGGEKIDPNKGAPKFGKTFLWGKDDWVEGCGNIISGNHFENAAHMMIWCRGPLQTIEYNYFENACYNASDMGVIYAGRRVHDIGTVIRYNHFKDIGEVSAGCYPCCVFIDDGSLDFEIYGNVFGPGVEPCEITKSHGGVEHNIYHNVAINATEFFQNSAWSPSRWYPYYQNVNNNGAGPVPYVTLPNKEIYTAEFPWMASYFAGLEGGQQYWGTNYIGKNALINLSGSCRVVSGSSYLSGQNTNPQFTGTDKKDFFVDYDNGDFTLSEKGLNEILAKIPDFENIPFNEIGLKGIVNEKPAAVAVSVIKSDDKLAVNYLYMDEERDVEGISEIKWMIGDYEDGKFAEITGENGKKLDLTDDLKGKYIRAEITPVDYEGRKGIPVLTKPLLYTKDARGIEYTIDSIVLKNAAGTEVLNSFPSTSFKAEVTITNISSEFQDLIILAFYDENNSLVEFSCEKTVPGTGNIYTKSFSVKNVNGNIVKAKAFILPSLGSLTPLAIALEIGA